MGCFIGDNNLTRLPSELASPNSGDWTGTGEDGELVIASRMLDSMVLKPASGSSARPTLAAGDDTGSSLTLPPGAMRMNKIQIATTVTATRVNAAEAFNDGAFGVLGGAAGSRSFEPGSRCTSVLSGFNRLNHSDTDIERPARCDDNPLARVCHCLRLNREGLVAMMPRSRASLARRRRKGCDPVSNS